MLGEESTTGLTEVRAAFGPRNHGRQLADQWNGVSVTTDCHALASRSDGSHAVEADGALSGPAPSGIHSRKCNTSADVGLERELAAIEASIGRWFQSLYGSASFSPAITTMIGRSVCSTRIVSP